MASVQRNIECGANSMTFEQVQVHDEEEHKMAVLIKNNLIDKKNSFYHYL